MPNTGRGTARLHRNTCRACRKQNNQKLTSETSNPFRFQRPPHLLRVPTGERVPELLLRAVHLGFGANSSRTPCLGSVQPETWMLFAFCFLSVPHRATGRTTDARAPGSGRLPPGPGDGVRTPARVPPSAAHPRALNAAEVPTDFTTLRATAKGGKRPSGGTETICSSGLSQKPFAKGR